MFSAIIYKEYLKTYKIIAIFTVLIICCLFNTYFDLVDSLTTFDSTSAILYISQMGKFDFNNLNYVCVLFAIFLAVAQFYPEVSNARIRLFLHLPMSYFSLVSTLVFVGLLFLCLVFIIISLLYYFTLISFFPVEIFHAIFSRLLPFFLASILCYFTTMIVFLEPNPTKKIAYIAISYLILDKYLILSQIGFFVSNTLNIFISVIILIYVVLVYDVFTSYKKGYIK